jgi:cytochrome c oxidase subunit III
MSSTVYNPAGTARKAAIARTEAAHTGVWVGVAAISMCFAALTSAMVVREGSGLDWQRFALPGVLYFNTLVLLASSVTMELGRRRFTGARVVATEKATAHCSGPTSYWLSLTLALGLIFVFGQVLAWRNLAAEGVFLATSPTSSFFYVLTALHALHVLGGLAALVYVLHRLSGGGPSQRSAVGAAAVYWHFMDLLWLYLLAVIVARM